MDRNDIFYACLVTLILLGIIYLVVLLINELIFMKELAKLTKELQEGNKESQKLINNLKLIKEIKITDEK